MKTQRALWMWCAAPLIAALGVLALAGFSSHSSHLAVSASQCGSKPGVQASGTPIKLGVIVTKAPGTDFTDTANMANAYFDCVNANGGVNGHPIQYEIQTEQINPTQIAGEAHKLVADGVVGIVGSISPLECTIDHTYWEKLGYAELDAGIAPECYSTPNSAAVNMGARFSSDGAVQYALAKGAKKIVFVQGTLPIQDYIFAGVKAVAGAKHVPVVTISHQTPDQNASSTALQAVQDAGANGAVVLDDTPPNALPILQAAQKLGLVDRVKMWGCSTPCNTDYLAQALGPKWNGKLFVNSELAPPDAINSASMQLYRAILKQYGSSVSGGVGSLSQMGFTIGEITVHALDTIKGAYTVQSVSAALKAVKNFNTGQLCRPWTYGNYAYHVPNNVDWTVTPKNGKMVIAQGCTAVSGSDPLIAGYRKLAGG